eukprot:4678_1
MALDLKRVQSVDEKTKRIVYGFIRTSQLQGSFCKVNIPDIVQHICLLFYWQTEYFRWYGKGIQMSHDQLSINIEQGHGGWNTCYGNLEINTSNYPSCIIQYEVEFNVKPSYGALGIASAETKNTNKLIWNRNKNHQNVYSYHNGSLYHIGDCSKTSGCYVHKPQDKITMTVNIPEESLTFWSVTQEKQLGKYMGIDYSTTFRFAVSLTGQQSISLLSFKITKQECA